MERTLDIIAAVITWTAYIVSGIIVVGVLLSFLYVFWRMVLVFGGVALVISLIIWAVRRHEG